ncbi:uncharacterized protein LOC128721289 [Anopheles nili]|uniref:uncharacterized protein LOC128721289 n=1 Tax=Anopheles nili TaxID=185578 RepID=UPI00237C4BA2|nr:uncharacterized protein LOC128721289 [Anopheles nili]
MYSKILNYPVASTTSAHSRFSASASASVSSNLNTTSSTFNYDNLQLDDILCSVCQSVLIEPVVLPCQHLFCRNCLHYTAVKTNLHCPCCRKRFGTWYRNASRANELVHEQLWHAIQNQFREHLDEDPSSGLIKNTTMHQVQPVYSTTTKSSIQLANPGEIQKEFNEELKRYKKHIFDEQTKELVASDQCIISLYKKEGIIDLADNSSHVSVSSTTTPELPERAIERKANESRYPSDICSVAGPSTLSKSSIASQNATIEVKNTHTLNPVSPSNGSVISISSTSSAASGSTASSCATTSSASGRYSLIKSVAQKVGRSAEIVKQKVQDTILHRLTDGKPQQHQRSLNAVDLNKSQLCVKPTAVHKTEFRGVASDETEVDDTDSLKSEQNHFIPIVQSMPKSSFSCSTFRRVPAVRPVPSPVKYNTTPKKSPYQPLKFGRTASAFKVVKLEILSPSKNLLESCKNSPVANNEIIPKRAVKRGRPRRVNLTLDQPTDPAMTTTQSANADSSSSTNIRDVCKMDQQTIKNIIISDQLRREQQIEMERRDFEFAQKLQQKLNRSSGIMQEIQRQSTAPRSTCYSLRRKVSSSGFGDISQSTIGNASNSNSSVEFNLTELTPSSSSTKKTSAQATRKRKATSSSVENDVPSSSSPAKRAAAQMKTRRQTRQSRSTNVNSTLHEQEEERHPCKLPQRKSTRNKTS